MENFQQRILKGIDLFKNNIWLFISICLISSVLAIYGVPFFINGSLTEQQINQEISQVGQEYGGALAISASQIIASLIFMFRFAVISTILLIVAYIVKYKIDKDMFRINTWRDWKFFLYVSAISLIIVDIFQNITAGYADNFIINLVLTVASCLLMVIFSSMILPEEFKPVNMEEIKH
jgi:hypothetical protein